jgi:hypothetical protein
MTVDNTQAPQRVRRIAIREIVPIYWRRLIEVGVPINAAKVIAWAIARYDVVHKVPEPGQQVLISQYCRFICRAQLWRSDLLLAPVRHA